MKKTLLMSGMAILLIADATEGSATPPDSESKGKKKKADETDAEKIARLEAENAALKAEKKKLSDEELLIAKKMAVGLSREQARHVITRQTEWDEVHGPKLRKEEDARRKSMGK